ncbi:hypothetical protein [Caballeronia sp. M23-90]
MADVYGVDYLSDVNVIRRTVKFGVGEMVVAQDRTTGTNSARTIFEERNTGKWCVVLISPPVASLLPGRTKGRSQRPSQWITRTQAAPGFPETKVIYIWSKQSLIFYPAHCLHIFPREVKHFNCSDAYK